MMKWKISLALLAVMVVGCSNMHRSENQAEDLSVRRGPVIGEQPGSQGPVGDYGRLKYGNRADREPTKKVETVADSTVTTSASPRVAEKAPVVRKAKRPVRRSHVVKARPNTNRARPTTTPRSAESTLLARTVALNELHHVNQREMAMARMAKEKGESTHVVNLADRILADHERLERKVEAVAEREGIKLRSYQPATYEVAAMETIEDLQGDRFDVVYLESMRVSHARTAANLKRTQSAIADRQVKSLIGEALPSMSRHSRLSRQAGQQLGRR